MIQGGPGRGVGRQPDETSGDEVSGHGRLARARNLSLDLGALWDKTSFFKANGAFRPTEIAQGAVQLCPVDAVAIAPLGAEWS